MSYEYEWNDKRFNVMTMALINRGGALVFCYFTLIIAFR